LSCISPNSAVSQPFRIPFFSASLPRTCLTPGNAKPLLPFVLQCSSLRDEKSAVLHASPKIKPPFQDCSIVARDSAGYDIRLLPFQNGGPGAGLALAIYAADFFLRAVRFWMLLNGVSPHPIPLKPTIAPFVASFGVSDVLPFRVGDVFRIYWFQQRFGIKVATLVGVMIVERVMDLLALVILGIVALRFIDGSRLSPLFGDFQLVLEVALIAAIARVIGFLEATLVAMHQSGSWRKIVFNVCFSVMIWILESCVLLAVWFSLGGNLSNWYPPVFAFVASSLATILPGLPGHFGSFEYFGVQAFLASGVSAEQAAAVLFLAHLILWAPTAIFAVVWLLAVRRGKDKTDKDKLATTSS
jgi:glycosyltransferase 2 family protein